MHQLESLPVLLRFRAILRSLRYTGSSPSWEGPLGEFLLQSKQQGYLFLLLVVGLAALSGWLFSRPDPAIQYGLDVRGGVRLTYQIKFDPKKEAEQRKELGRIQQNLVRVMNNRVSAALGVVEGTVQLKGDDELIVELPGFTDIEKARANMSSTAKLYAYEASNVQSPGNQFRRYTRGSLKQGPDGTYYEEFVDTLTNATLKPGDAGYAQMISEWKIILEGEDLARAGWQIGPQGTQPQFFFSATGTPKIEAWSRGAGVRQENLAFVLDGRVLSIAPLKEGVVLSNEAFIDGTFEEQYVMGLANLLNAGALPVELGETSSTQVSPTIGENALNQMIQAGLVSLGVITLFMLIYYIFPGFVAFIALMLYILFTLTLMKMIGATFSLAAIAGFILSVGMAVDANILVFERLKEELRAGRSLNTAVDLGFKRAFPAILDSNVCTILTSSVLFIYGSGQVKGFASTLILGVAMSMFTAVVVTRSLLVFLVSSGVGANPNLYGLNRNWFGEEMEANANTKPVKFMSKTRLWFAISLATMIPGMIFVGMGGIKPNVEFRGGIEAEFSQPGESRVTSAQVTRNLEAAGFEGPIVKVVDAPGKNVVTIKATVPAGQNPATPETRSALVGATKITSAPMIYKVDGQSVEFELLRPNSDLSSGEEIAKRLTDAGFTGVTATIAPRDLKIVSATIDPKKGMDANSPEARAEVTKAMNLGTEPMSFSTVGPTIQQETIRNAITGIVVASVLIVLWLTLRFGLAIGSWRKGLMFGLSAIAALIHDVVVVVGIAGIVGYFLNWQISTLFVTAMLTVIGFSVHDTIVIFDRIRENLRRPLSGENFEHLCNRSITQSVARSLNTSMMVIATLIIMIAIGTPTIDLKFFCITMLTGIISGTYSSIFNATPILYLWDKAVGRLRGEDHTLIADAIKEENRRKAAAQAAMAAGAGQTEQSFATVKRRRSVKDQARQDLD